MADTDPNMGFEVPTPSVEEGPDYAEQVSAALTTIGAHRHTGAPDDGLQIPVAGRLYDADLPLEGVGVTGARAVTFEPGLAVAADNASISVLESTGDLWYRAPDGTAIRITAGAALDTSGDNQVWQRVAVAADHTILNTDADVLIEVDCTGAPVEITLPTAASVSAGRRYVIADGEGAADSNPITITASGGDTIDGEAAHEIRSLFGKCVLVSNGSDGWLAFDVSNLSAGDLMADTLSLKGDTSLSLSAIAVTAAATAALTLGGATIVEKDGGTTLQTKDLNGTTIKHLVGATITAVSWDDADGQAVRLAVDSNGTTRVQIAKTVTVPIFEQEAFSGTGANDGASLRIIAQHGQDQSGGSDNNDGGDVWLIPGSAGSGGGGAAGVPGTLRLNVPTTTSAPGAGGGGALPATPTGYLRVKIADGTYKRIPYYPDA